MDDKEEIVPLAEFGRPLSELEIETQGPLLTCEEVKERFANFAKRLESTDPE